MATKVHNTQLNSPIHKYSMPNLNVLIFLFGNKVCTLNSKFKWEKICLFILEVKYFVSLEKIAAFVFTLLR